MKTFCTLLLSALAFSITSNAQTNIPNSGFENWATFGTPPTDYEDPTGWKSTNGSVAFSASRVNQSTDSHSGTYAAELKVVNVFGTSRATILTNGDVPNDFSDYEINHEDAGTPISIKPVSVSGYYKFIYDTASFDSAYAVVILKRWNTATLSSDTVGTGNITFLPASIYTLFNIPVTYTSIEMPDSIVVAFGNKATQLPAFNTPGKLLVDDISLDTLSTVVNDLQMDGNVDIYPNPLCSTAKVTIQNMSTKGNYTFAIYNLLGEEVSRIEPNAASFVIHRNNLSAGLYFYKLTIANALVSSGKLLVE